MQFVTPMPFVEAVQKLGGRSPIGSKLTSQEWSQVPLALRERAFFSATVENVRFLQRSKDALGDFLTSAREEITLPNGTKTTALKTGSRAQFIQQMREFALKEGMGPLDPKDAGGLKDIRSEQRLGLIFDVQTQAAQQYGSWKQGMDPDVLNEFPAQRFIREVDVRAPRIIHLQNEGVVRLKTDLEWWRGMNSPAIGGFGVPWGPWGFNSGMGVEDVDRDEAEALGLLTATDVVRPIEQDLNAVLQASVRTLSPAMVDRLRAAFGNQIEFVDGMARWRGAPPEPVSPVPAPLPPRPVAPQPEPAPAPAPVTVPAPVTAPTPVLPPARPAPAAPVSKALNVRIRGDLGDATAHAIAVVDRVHGDGVLPQIPVTRHAGSANGVFHSRRRGSASVPVDIQVSPAGPAPGLTAVHEIGHFLDLAAIGGGEFGTATGVLNRVLVAIKATKAFAEIKRLKAEFVRSRNYKAADHFDYLESDVELWARAYAQFIAIESRDPRLMEDLDWWRKRSSAPFRQWADDDFAAVADAIRTFFKEKGWM